jgi:alcohol dehydrogenase
MAEMFALKTIELVTKYLPRAVKDGSDMEAREMMAYASSYAGYYMLCISGHRIEHVIGSFHEDLPHGAGLILTAHAFYDFLAGKGSVDDRLVLMAKAMGRQDASSGQDFVDALDDLIAAVGCSDMKLSSWGITEEEILKYPAKIHHVLGGNIAADPVPITAEEYLEIYRKALLG